MTVQPNQGAYLQKQGDDPAYAGKESGHLYLDLDPSAAFDGAQLEFNVDVTIPADGDDVRVYCDSAEWGTAANLLSNAAQLPTATDVGAWISLSVGPDVAGLIERERIDANRRLDGPVVQKKGNILRAHFRYATAPAGGSWHKVRLYYFRRRTVTA